MEDKLEVKERLFEQINEKLMQPINPVKKIGWEIYKLFVQYDMPLENQVVLLTCLRNELLLNLVEKKGIQNAEEIAGIDQKEITGGIDRLINEGRI